MKLYIHPVCTQVYDYDEHIGVNHGVAWSTNNQPWSALALGVEWCSDRKAVRARIAAVLADTECPASVELAEGCPIERRTNMNPHGLI